MLPEVLLLPASTSPRERRGSLPELPVLSDVERLGLLGDALPGDPLLPPKDGRILRKDIFEDDVYG